MGSVIWSIIVRLVNADKLGGWTRALVAVLLGQATGWFGGVLAPFLTPELQQVIAAAVATAVVGFWSDIAKAVANKPAAQVASLAALPEVDNRELAKAVGPKLAKNVPL